MSDEKINDKKIDQLLDDLESMVIETIDRLGPIKNTDLAFEITLKMVDDPDLREKYLPFKDIHNLKDNHALMLILNRIETYNKRFCLNYYTPNLAEREKTLFFPNKTVIKFEVTGG